jgi:hypothetical protein
MYFIYLYENRTMKSAETILSKGEMMRENDGGDERDQDTL